MGSLGGHLAYPLGSVRVVQGPPQGYMGESPMECVYCQDRFTPLYVESKSVKKGANWRTWLEMPPNRSDLAGINAELIGKYGESDFDVGMARFRPQRAQMMPLGIGYCGLPMLIFLPTETLGPRPQGS